MMIMVSVGYFVTIGHGMTLWGEWWTVWKLAHYSNTGATECKSFGLHSLRTSCMMCAGVP